MFHPGRRVGIHQIRNYKIEVWFGVDAIQAFLGKPNDVLVDLDSNRLAHSVLDGMEIDTTISRTQFDVNLIKEHKDSNKNLKRSS